MMYKGPFNMYKEWLPSLDKHDYYLAINYKRPKAKKNKKLNYMIVQTR